MNRLVSNVIVVDSAAGNTPIINTISNSTGQISKFRVNAISFWSANTTGACNVACGDGSAGVIAMFSWVNGGAGFAPANQSTQFGQQQLLEDIKVPLLTAGTAFIYLC